MGGESGGRKASKRQRKEDDAAQAAIREKLKSIIIPKVDFEGTTLEESVDFLCLRMAELDPDPDLEPTQRGVKVGFRVAAGEDIFERPLSEWSSRRIRDIARNDVSAWELLYEIARETGMKVEITETGIEMMPRE
ncbi:hypothetical protein OJ996_08255 [Luteolibacter sp. GHJ8]|uniref:Uncharacterized protein n=1 Tax=Luteolibacter rhizosphaerae TaxID=2989719 RepID=A0ABT3G167_9BACT|nr:hypothetical protein [Luteolibacter rhizosphaerae]MCW1913563.1 hypothetical protein [Luteolibacter rhizosphaerae]